MDRDCEYEYVEVKEMKENTVSATFAFEVECGNMEAFIGFQQRFFKDISYQIEDENDCRLVSLSMEVGKNDDH